MRIDGGGLTPLFMWSILTVIPTPGDHNAVAYVYDGCAWLDRRREPGGWEVRADGYTERIQDPLLGNHTLIRFSPGDEIHVETTDGEAVRFLLMTGKPLHEPVAWGGPIVMNTRAELQQAYHEIEEGTFLKG